MGPVPSEQTDPGAGQRPRDAHPPAGKARRSCDPRPLGRELLARRPPLLRPSTAGDRLAKAALGLIEEVSFLRQEPGFRPANPRDAGWGDAGHWLRSLTLPDG